MREYVCAKYKEIFWILQLTTLLQLHVLQLVKENVTTSRSRSRLKMEEASFLLLFTFDVPLIELGLHSAKRKPINSRRINFLAR